MRRTSGRKVTAALAAVIIWAATGEVEAKTLAVAVHGTDDATCGGKATPCRSIARAIANAAAGDSIVVGPGRYGDLDGDGVLGEAGEEPAPDGVSHMLLIDKALSVTSRDGALATVIDASGAPRDLVRIEAPGVVFGKAKKGFTVQNAPAGFVGVLVAGSNGSGVVIAGNRALANDSGFVVNAPGGVLVTGNQAAHNRIFGFLITGAGFRLVGNEVLGSGATASACSPGATAGTSSATPSPATGVRASRRSPTAAT